MNFDSVPASSVSAWADRLHKVVRPPTPFPSEVWGTTSASPAGQLPCPGMSLNAMHPIVCTPNEVSAADLRALYNGPNSGSQGSAVCSRRIMAELQAAQQRVRELLNRVAELEAAGERQLARCFLTTKAEEALRRASSPERVLRVSVEQSWRRSCRIMWSSFETLFVMQIWLGAVQRQSTSPPQSAAAQARCGLHARPGAAGLQLLLLQYMFEPLSVCSQIRGQRRCPVRRASPMTSAHSWFIKPNMWT